MTAMRDATPAAAAAPAQEVCTGCEWGPRGDRSEGVKTKSLMISGGSFELLSVGYRSPAEGGPGIGKPAKGGPDSLVSSI